jgi:pimeloyl-ACP methyl ester carboxylesterase
MARKPLSRVRGPSVAAAAGLHPAPSEDDIIQSLAGESDKVSDQTLEELFGSDVHELRRLAGKRASAPKSRGAAPKVYLLHGILGAELGRRRWFWEDVIWLGITDVVLGKLKLLRLGKGGDPNIKALGFLPGVYLLMRLQLESEGFEVVQHFYDWRQSVADLGAELKRRVEAEKSKIMIVAHSMGGLVTRAAFKLGMKKVSRFIMLATPNHGSLAAIEALRGQYGVARTIAAADLSHDAGELAQDVFSTFKGLYQLVLARRLSPALDLFDAASWPQSGPQPDPRLLALARHTDDLLAKPVDTPDIPWYNIAGVDQQTKVAAKVEGSEFVYTVTREGDGTVPLESALLPGVQKTWFASAGHGLFANDGRVRTATADILRTGDTTALTTNRPAVSRAAQLVRESELRTVAETRNRTRGGTRMSHTERLRAIFAAPEAFSPPQDAAATDTQGGYVHRLEQVTIGRKRQRRFEVAFYNGSITDVTARAYVLGTFSGVTPSGAASALDQLMGGAITELIGDNMFGSRTGEIFILPLARREVRAEVGVFVGMGQYDEFKPVPSPAPGGRGTQAYIHTQHIPALEIAAENAARMLTRTHVDEFATVIIGGSVSDDVPAMGESMLRGFLRGLADAEGSEGVRRVVICETNADRYRAMRQHLVYLATTPLCEGIEFVLSEMDAPPEVSRLRALGVSAAATGVRAAELVYLLVRTETDAQAAGLQSWKFALLGPSNRAAVREDTMSRTKAKIKELLDPVAGEKSPDLAQVAKLGRAIASELVPEIILEELRGMTHLPLVILHDAEASKIPWETMAFDATRPGQPQRPALTSGISRRFLAATSACARWSASGARNERVNVLLISNPTGDLPGAAQEAESIKKALSANPRFVLDNTLRGDEATREAILAKLSAGGYDIVHYSGHAHFDETNRDACGLLCARDEVLTGKDIAGIATLPFLMMLNACQSARQRGSARAAAKKPALASPPRTIAETMLCSGIANFIGTYWPVSDLSASTFAERFYAAILENKSLGDAMLAARNAIKTENDWANYVLYGNRDARLRAD